MTPLDKIKEGILKNDMEKVIDGYEILTGERLSSEKAVQGKVPKQVQKRSKARSGDSSASSPSKPTETPKIPQEQPVKEEGDFTAPARKQIDKKTKYTKSQQIEVGKNTFVDDGVQHKDDTTPDLPLTPRNRAGINYVEVKCHVCGKEEEINPLLKAGDFYRCNECVG
ncbi:hypothetical protein CL634_05465 [bacterium]|nr:hypothetical protein [bacterium]